MGPPQGGAGGDPCGARRSPRCAANGGASRHRGVSLQPTHRPGMDRVAEMFAVIDYSITSSAMASRVAGISRLSVLAVRRFLLR